MVIDSYESVFDTNRFATKEALREIHRVVRPGATFGMIWNIEDCKFLLPPLGGKTDNFTLR